MTPKRLDLNTRIIVCSIAIIMLLLATLKMPYGYYTFLKIVIFIISSLVFIEFLDVNEKTFLQSLIMITFGIMGAL